MKYLSMLVFAACAMCSVSAYDDDWAVWKQEHGKIYVTEEEEATRRLIWQKRLEMVVEHNLEYQLGHYSYDIGMNQFSDLEHDEFVAMMTCRHRNAISRRAGSSIILPLSDVELPDEVDWRTKGYVTPVKHQEACGSCWAFSATGSLEGLHFKETGNLVNLSEQNLVDCSSDWGNNGCGGGDVNQALQYVIDNHGINTEESYPYKATEDNCSYSAENVGAICTNYTNIPSGDENALQQAVAQIGPISVSIDSSQPSFDCYTKGVYNETNCTSTNLTHCGLVVGYGTTNDSQDYWIVKNSWGTGWGMEGYIWMSRNKSNQCGIASEASYPTQSAGPPNAFPYILHICMACAVSAYIMNGNTEFHISV